jgi:hypothetical protein
MLNDTKVFGAHAEHGGPVDLCLPTNEISLLRVQRFAVLVLPGLFGVVAVVEEDCGRVPVELLLRHEGAALQNEDVFACLGQVQSQRSATRSSADHNRVVFAWHIHLQHGIRFTCSKLRIHCRQAASKAAINQPMLY